MLYNYELIDNTDKLGNEGEDSYLKIKTLKLLEDQYLGGKI